MVLAQQQEVSAAMLKDVCATEGLGNKTECMTIHKAVMTKGLLLANAAYIKVMRDIIRGYITLSAEMQTRAYVYKALNSEAMITSEIFFRKYVNPAYKLVVNQIRNSIDTVLNRSKPLNLGTFVIFIVFLLGSILWVKLSYINGLRNELFSDKAVISSIPIDMILSNSNLKNYIMECSSAIVIDISSE